MVEMTFDGGANAKATLGWYPIDVGQLDTMSRGLERNLRQYLILKA